MRLGGVIKSVQKKQFSYGLITLPVNEDKAKSCHFRHYVLGEEHLHFLVKDNLDYVMMVLLESRQSEEFVAYLESLNNKRVLVESKADSSVASLINPCDASRYFSKGRNRCKARIRRRLGRWYNCPGLLVSLTFSPDLISRADAWRECRSRGREFMNRVNRWRKRRGMPRAKYLSVIELQKGTGYPHLHLVFPYLKYLAPINFMTVTWGQGEFSVDYKVKDSFSPVSYVCKYITKLDGWSDVALSYIWKNRTRLYSMSRDYSLPDYSDKRVSEWEFRGAMTLREVKRFVACGIRNYKSVKGCFDFLGQVGIGSDT